MSSDRLRLELEDREVDLRLLIDEIRTEIAQRSWKFGDSNKIFEKKLVHGETLLRELQNEIRKAPLMYQHLYSSKALKYQSELISLRSRLQIESKGDDDFEIYEDERAQLLKNTDTLNRASSNIYRAQKVSAHTDELAVNVMGQLNEQKSMLHKTNNRLNSIDLETRRSNVLLSTFACKAMQNRILLITIIVVEMLVLFGLLFYKLYKRFK